MSFQKGTNTKTYRNNLIIKHYFRPSKTIVSLKRHPPHLATTIHKQQSNGTFFSHLIFLYNLCQPSTSFNRFEDISCFQKRTHKSVNVTLSYQYRSYIHRNVFLYRKYYTTESVHARRKFIM